VCPLGHALAVQERYPGSRLLIQDSYGHCALLAAPSRCTAKHLRAFFVEGILPASGTVCEVDELPFVGEVGGKVGLSDEDAELLEALKAGARKVPWIR
jgi:hypothetical protein